MIVEQASKKARELWVRSYRPRLDTFISQCEMNFCLLMRLIPEWNRPRTTTGSFVKVPYSCFCFMGKGVSVYLQLCEQAPYTSTVSMALEDTLVATTAMSWWQGRIYHDAKMLEMMDGSLPRLSAPNPVQSLPNRHMLAIDEKEQRNRFLGECLKYALSTGIGKPEKIVG